MNWYKKAQNFHGVISSGLSGSFKESFDRGFNS